jgi:hypothetical protein
LSWALGWPISAFNFYDDWLGIDVNNPKTVAHGELEVK